MNTGRKCLELEYIRDGILAAAIFPRNPPTERREGDRTAAVVQRRGEDRNSLEESSETTIGQEGRFHVFVPWVISQEGNTRSRKSGVMPGHPPLPFFAHLLFLSAPAS